MSQDVEVIGMDYSKLDFDTIILLAGHSSVKMSEGDLTSCYHNNVTNFVELLDRINKNYGCCIKLKIGYAVLLHPVQFVLTSNDIVN
jgi:UDP-glucose 4-epimerase